MVIELEKSVSLYFILIEENTYFKHNASKINKTSNITAKP